MPTYDFTVYSPPSKPKRIHNLTGQRFNHLLVIGLAGVLNGHSMWHCLCVACKSLVIKKGINLSFQKPYSCGCCHKSVNYLHGESVSMDNTPEYQAYLKAKQRCNGTYDKAYKDYGGRGIEFRFESYAEFLTEVGRKPTPKHSLDRKDNEGHYEKGNIRWATQLEQARNKRNSRIFTSKGITQAVEVWAEQIGVTGKAIRSRIDKFGWCVDCAVSLPPRDERCPHRQGFATYSEEYGKRRLKWRGPVRKMRRLHNEQMSK